MDDTLVRRIRDAMRSPKFEAGAITMGLRHEFEDLLMTRPDADFSSEWISLLVEASRPDKKFPGQLSAPLGNVYCVLCPYDKLPETVDDPDVLKIEYSTSDPRFITDE